MLVVAGSPYQKQLPRPFSKIKGCIFDSILRIHICQSKKNKSSNKISNSNDSLLFKS